MVTFAADCERSLLRVGFARILTSFFVCLTIVISGQQQAPQSSQQPPLRSGVTMVPVDVRVTDRDGKPITDLAREDFVVFEDDAPQRIEFFSVQALTAAEAQTPSDDPLRLGSPSPALAAADRRVFLIMLGRGLMTGPTRVLDGLDEFVAKKLLPQDQVAVLAWNRATDFTSDHTEIAAVLKRYRMRHTRIEALFAQHFSGLQALYGSSTIPSGIQKLIDEVFEGSSGRQVTPTEVEGSKQMREDLARTADELIRVQNLKERRDAGDPRVLPDPSATETGERLDLSFDQYVQDRRELAQDLSNIYAGIAFLRHIQGEKHLVFVSPRGLSLDRVEHDRSLGARASDARVALHVLYTFGPGGAAPPRFAYPPDGGMRIVGESVASPSAVFGQTFNVSAMRHLTELTGGELTAFRRADDGLSRLDISTRFQYLLGYYPSNGDWNGGLRKIRVSVNRPGAVVRYRHSYYASRAPVNIDRREYIPRIRMIDAARYDREISDVAVAVTSSEIGGPPQNRELHVSAVLDASTVRFTAANGRHTAAIDFALYAGDGRERVVGETLSRIDLDLSDTSLAAAMRQGIAFDVRLSLTGDPTYLKLIVYDYTADRLGSVQKRLR